MFTKRHYERIAQAFAETKGYYDGVEVNAAVDGVRNYIAEELADMFAEDNPRFNRKLFMAAAKAESHERKKAERAARKREAGV